MKNENESFAHILQRLAVSSSTKRLLLLQHEGKRQDELQWQASAPSVWFQYMIQQLSSTQIITYWSTIDRPISLPPSVHIVRSGRDPLQWETTSSSCSLPLHDLSLCLQYFQQQHASKWLFIESLQPLLLLHGFHTTWQLLQHWPGTLAVAASGMLTAAQHRRMEDAAWGVVMTQHQPAVFLRKGIRESSNVLRQIIPYSVVPRGDELQLEVVSEKEDDTPEAPPTQPRGNKVQLQFENDDKQPRIYLQENDPERPNVYYSDEEDEDPDGDLDL
jgi:hypothetical protein